MSILRKLMRIPWKPRLPGLIRFRPLHLVRALAIPLAVLLLDQVRRRRRHDATDRAEEAAAAEALYILANTPCEVCGRLVDPREPHAIQITRQPSRRRFKRGAVSGSAPRITVLCEKHMHQG
jgi:hypothetical protein